MSLGDGRTGEDIFLENNFNCHAFPSPPEVQIRRVLALISEMDSNLLDSLSLSTEYGLN